MKIIYLLVAVLAMSLGGCCGPGYYTRVIDSDLVQKIDAEELTRTTVRYCARLKHDKGLTLEDSRCFYTECSERFKLVFSSQRIIEIGEARELITDVVEGYLAAINNNPSLRADLCLQPLTYRNIEVFINFESWFAIRVDPFYVGWIEMDEGLVTYYMSTAKQWHFDRWHLRYEPYLKALEIARAQREASLLYPPEGPSFGPDEGLSSFNLDATPNRQMKTYTPLPAPQKGAKTR